MPEADAARARSQHLGGDAYNDSVVPGEDGKFIEARDKIPSSGDVASYEDTKGEDGEWVHRIAMQPGRACGRDRGTDFG